MANSFLDKTGLTYLWSKIVALVGTKQDTLTFDNSPTNNSSNPVKSGGVYSALAGKAASDHTQAADKGGTGQTSYTTGDILYASGSTTLSKLAGNTTTTQKFLAMTGTGSAAAAPEWVEAAGGDAFVTKITYSSGSYYSSKTVAEITEAFNAGKAVFAQQGTQNMYLLKNLTSANATFSRFYYSSNGDGDGGLYEELLGIRSSDRMATTSSTLRMPRTLIENVTIDIDESDGQYSAYCGTMNDPTISTLLNLSDYSLTGGRHLLRARMFVEDTTQTGDPPEYPTSEYWFNLTDSKYYYEWDSSEEYWVRRDALVFTRTDIKNGASKHYVITITSTEDGDGGLLSTANVTYTEAALGGDFLPLSGGTMTGDLTMESGAKLSVKGASIDISSTPSSSVNQNVVVGTDASGNIINFMRSIQDTSGATGVEFNSRRTVGNTTYFNGVTFKIGSDGTRSMSVSDASMWRSALGLGSMATESASSYLPLSGGTMTGPITLASTGLYTNNAAGYAVNQYGNFTHRRTNSSDTWGIIGANGNALTVAYDTGNTTVSGTLIAPTMKVYDASTPMFVLQSSASDTSALGAVYEDLSNRQMVIRQRATNGYVEDYKFPANSATANTSYDILTTKTPVTAFKDMTISLSSLASGTWTSQSITQFTTPTGYVRTGISVVGGSTTAMRSYVYALTNANANWVLLYNASSSAVSGTLTLRASYVLQSQSTQFTQ